MLPIFHSLMFQTVVIVVKKINNLVMTQKRESIWPAWFGTLIASFEIGTSRQ